MMITAQHLHATPSMNHMSPHAYRVIRASSGSITRKDEHMSLVNNPTIDVLLRRKSVRRFADTPIPDDIVETLETAAQRAATSQYLNSWSAIRITDPDIKRQLSELSTQTFVADAPLLYIFVADQHRNTRIAHEEGVDITSDDLYFNSPAAFGQAKDDAVLALHAMETAAFSLGLGAVIMAAIVMHTREVIELLHLPKLTYPILGIALGVPEEPVTAPATKPRLPKDTQFFDNTYPTADEERLLDPQLNEFDKQVAEFYRQRGGAAPASFKAWLASRSVRPGLSQREPFSTIARDQGFGF
ncbi:NADPH-dependent oxidoreductase [Bifidobacterium rousetti]|nr:NADPH-dependent oxidoreductase [Bifidobacterium rousetti]